MASDSDLLDACYGALLGRSPDQVALSHWMVARDESIDVGELLTSIVTSHEFAVRWKDAIVSKATSGAVGFFNEQSQFGEVGRLILNVVNTAATHKLVVDVGANGRERSNSYDLLRFFGWRGLLIEANQNRNRIIEDEFSGLDYQLVNCAISDYAGTATFHLGVNDDVSSLQIDAAQGWGPVRGEMIVDVRPLPEVLRERNIPYDFDLLSIDAEGEDIRILNDTIDKGYRPRWVIVEVVHDASAPSLDHLDVTELVKSHYQIVDQTVSNLILRFRNT